MYSSESKSDVLTITLQRSIEGEGRMKGRCPPLGKKVEIHHESQMSRMELHHYPVSVGLTALLLSYCSFMEKYSVVMVLEPFALTECS